MAHEALGYRNQLDNVAVHTARTAVVVSDSQFDTIHIEFRATADDYRVDVLTGRRVGSPSVAPEFVEYWSFDFQPGDPCNHQHRPSFGVRVLHVLFKVLEPLTPKKSLSENWPVDRKL